MNMCKTMLIGLTAALMLAVGLLQTASAQTAAMPAPTRLAVIDIVKVFDSLNEKIQTDQDMKARGDVYNDKKRAYQDSLDKLTAQLKDFKPDSPEYSDISDKLLHTAMEARAYQEYTQQKMLLDRRTKTALLYKKINDAVAQYSQASGIALVLVADEANLAGAQSEEEMLSRITIRKVIYASPTLDISQAIVDKMNTEFKIGTPK